MTEEEILRKKLDWLNQNSYYGIMIDTEITDIVRRHIKRLEEKEMNATSVQKIENVNEMHFTIEKSCVDDITKVIVGASTNDDIFEFHFSGEGCVVFADQWFNMVADKAYKADFESERNKRQMMETANKQLIQENKDLKKRYDLLNKKFNRVMNNNLPETPITDAMIVNDYNRLVEENKKLEEELGEWKKEAADCLRLRDEVRREKNKEINKLKQQLQQAENDKKRLTYKLQENKTECENCLAGASLVDDYFKLAKKNEQLTFEKEMIKKENDKLKKELALEKAANEAQHKFIREYAGKGTEVQFNYAIDDVKEVSYVIVDKEENECKCESCSAGASYEEMYRNLRDKLEKENKRLRQENGELKYMLNDIKFTKDLTEMCLNTRAGILDQAKKCVCGQREQDYGTPESNFQLIADLWNDYLKKERLGRSKTVVDAVDVSMMMALMKIARIRNGGGSGDSFVDLAGYAACGGEIWHGQKAKDQN